MESFEEWKEKLKRDINRPHLLKDFPRILYKYRNWKTPYHQDLLIKRKLFFASPDQFNDPFDCKIPFILNKEELSKDKLFEILIQCLREDFPGNSETELHKMAYKEQMQNELYDENYIEERAKYNHEQIKNNFGVLSLSADEMNFLNWSHYSESHTGYCIGFDTFELDKICYGLLEPVRYQIDIPEIKIDFHRKDRILEFLRIMLFVKSSEWAYEKEYRITKNAFANRIVEFSEECIKEVIFGCKMSIETKFEILEIIKKNYPNISVFEMNLHKTKFSLEKQQIR
jgi:hypothetical protein